MKYDRDNIDPDIVEKVSLFCQRDDFTPKLVKKASVAAAGLCQWVHAMIKYDKVAKEVEPYDYAARQKPVRTLLLQSRVGEACLRMKVVQDELAGLRRELRVTMEKKDKLESDVKICADRLKRAEQLISGLEWRERSLESVK